MDPLERKLEQLTPEQQKKVTDFIDIMLNEQHKESKKLKLDWAGGLSKYGDKYSPLELQKKAFEWTD